MRKKKTFKSFICLLLCAVMTLGLFSSAFANDDIVYDDTDDIEVTDTVTDADAEESEALDADKEETGFENAIVALTADPDYGYGLYGGYDGQNSMNDPDTAGACVGWDDVSIESLYADAGITTYSAMASSGLWWIDDYYVDAGSLYDVSVTDDFSLKYQVEFHTSQDIEAEAIEIVINASLGTYRNGNNILPNDIGVPYGTPDNYTESSASPFNYYYATLNEDGTVKDILTTSEASTCTETVYIVLWNYKDIVSGSNAMVQVLYKELDAMQIPDMTDWALDVEATVSTEDVPEETVQGNTLTGVLDTSVTLNYVTKSAYYANNKSYTPELYTENQVSNYIDGSIPNPYASNFDDYIYLVWHVTIKGEGNQAYTIEITDNSGVDGDNAGSVVGWKLNSHSSGLSFTYDSDKDAYVSTGTYSTAENFSADMYVVTAYPASSYDEGEVIDNYVDVTVTPYDGYDADISKEATDSVSWGEYEWNYIGDIIGIKKYGNGSYRPYLELYKQNQIDEKDTGSFKYTTTSTDRCFMLTHYVDMAQDGSLFGSWNGGYVTTTTVDDVLYACAGSDARQLDYDDYYFDSVNVTVKEVGYDVWEDEETKPNESDKIDDPDLHIYAMFPDNPGEWQYVNTVPYSSSGTMTYTFSEDDIARQPYRIKAIVNCADYSVLTTIDTTVTLRYDSPIMAWYMDKYGDDLSTVSLENLSGVAGQTYNVPGYSNGYYFQDTDTDEFENYSEKDSVTGETLADWTRSTYNTILMRDNGYDNLTSLESTSAAYKAVETSNDTANGRVLADYYLTAYEAYYVDGGTDTVDTLIEAGISLPDRSEVSFYDLLPYGVKYNGSVQPVAGYISNMNSSGTWRTNTGAWTSKDVTVTVTDDDVIDNWNGTGRTMVIFHLQYTGDDMTAYYSSGSMWYEGYGVYFQAYYDWEDINSVDAEYNIASYIIDYDAKLDNELLGVKDSAVFKDDGSGATGNYAPFDIVDLNNDGITDKYTNMYCSATTNTNISTATSDSIKKLVRADTDVMAEYKTTAIVGEGKGYTYEISLTNTTASTMTNIVLFDKLEYAVEDGRVEVEEENNPNNVFKDLNDDDIYNHWTGTFNGLTLTALDDLGIDYTIYYNSNRNAVISSEDGTTTPSDVLTTANGWYTADAYPNNIDTVKAVAVDLDGYELTAGESLSIQVHMIAPKESDYTYAFNNLAYYSVSEALAGGTETSATDIGDTVRVEIGQTGTLTVTKQVNGDIPSSFSNSSFTFTVLRNGVPLANQEYTVNGFVYSTDVNGQFTLKDGQTAVFEDIVDVSDVEVIESESVYWERTHTSENRNGSYTADYTFTNEYSSPAYFYKTVQTTDLASEDELTNAEFTFQIKVDTNGDGTYDSTYSNGRVLYVDSVKTNGAEPNIIGETTTNANGEITLKIGDIIVFYPDGGNIGTSYQVTETSTGESWICENDTVTGKTSAYGTSSTITNYYKYRALILTKSLNRYDGEDTFTFTFNITDADGNALNGNRYYEINDNNEVINSGTITNGLFTMTDNNNRIAILDLIEGESYNITETNYDTDLFIPAQDDITVTMPIYSVTKSAGYTNTYRYSDLEVQKIALSSNSSINVNTYEFEYTLKDKNGNPVSGAAYTIVGGDGTIYYTDSEGHFTVHGNETVYFDDLGHMGDKYTVTETVDADFPQLSPSNGNGYDVTLDNDTVSVQFVNGDFDNIVSVQKDLVGKDKLAESFVDFVYNRQYGGGASIYDKNGFEVLYSVDVTFGIYDNNNECVTSDEGALIDYEANNSDYPYVYIAIKLNTRGSATVTVQSYNGGEMTQTLYPYDTIYIAEIGNNTVKAEETGGYYEGIYRVLGLNFTMWSMEYPDWVLIEPEIQSGSAVSGDSIVLVNNVYTADETSAIYKVMTDSSYEVPSGESIVFRVERYNTDTDTWTPAEGIKYIKMTGEISDSSFDGGTNTSGLLETGSDGIITLTKDDDGYPWIRFTEDTVYANVYTDANDGDLRIVELLDESDDDWGMLIGYDSADWVNGPALNVTPADTFVNGNDSEYVFDIEKTSETANEGDTFTFTLTQVTSAVTSPITSMSDVLDSTAGAYIDYVIYDSDTGTKIGEGQTDANGQFTLEANQYARFYVPDGTVWIVYEGLTPSYYIDSVTANEADDANVIDETEGLIGKETEAYTTATLILTLTDIDGNPIEGGTFTLYCDDTAVQTDLVTDKNGQITVTVSETGNYYFKETSVPSGYDTPDNLKTDTVSVNKLLETYEFTMTNAKAATTVNYAVRLYGICFDDTEDGSKASLTFGAAIGEGNLLNSYVSRETVGETNHPSTYCIHDMSWAEIIDICNTYKGNEAQLKAIFGDCLDNGCTKAVPLTTDDDDNLFNSTTVNNAIAQGYTGDGVSTLYYLLDTHSLRTLYWNLSYTGYSDSDPANIYQRSRVRSTLTGDNSTIETQLTNGGNNYYYDDTYPLFDESTCLFASFPTELQNAITPKAIVSDTDRSDETTYDTLWLPSMHELGFSVSYDKTPGNAYTKTDGSTLFSSNSDRIAYEFNGTRASSSSASYYWSRSRDSYSSYRAYYVYTSGSNGSVNVNYSYGLSPAFCIG